MQYKKLEKISRWQYETLAHVSRIVSDLLVDTADGKYVLEEATVDEGEYRTVFKISLLNTGRLGRKEREPKEAKKLKEATDYSIQAL